ncbi:unnamed protein product [Durusdinium trenchii]|uniref:Large ribosomal subunit protein bL12 C-terminal domain-containing protein n=1 Tax=Durusdinium trenchii TaxID=1381693 RepID=A0ABP0SYH0_9DINO
MRPQLTFRRVTGLWPRPFAFEAPPLLRRSPLPAVPVRALQLRHSGDVPSFDIFQKIKDPPEEGDGPAKGKRRKPSDKVLRIVDEIMSLTLIEAADLCDLCQEKLSDGALRGRMPFPHPAGMFSGMPMPMPMAGAMPAMPMPQAAPAAAPVEEAAAAEAPKEAKKEEKKKEVYTIKLVGFESSKKINVVKEVRAITAIGLKEAKELVESAPKVVKKGVPAADAETMRDKLVAAGAEVALE